MFPTAREAYESLWDHFNGARRIRIPTKLGDKEYALGRSHRTIIDASTRWEANPWVWALTFRCIEVSRG